MKLSRQKKERQKSKPRRENELSLKVEDLMIKDVITVDANLTVKEAAQIMNKFEIGCLLAVRNGKAIGIITERDLLKRIVAESRSATKTKVKEVMSTPLIVVEPDMELEDAAKLMFEMKIKKLPVVEGKRLVGLITLTDIARFQPQVMKILKQLSKRQAMPKRMQKIINHYVV
jgi:CBS domain-containing protein